MKVHLLTPQDELRFWEQVGPETEGGCWPWDGALDTGGYGQIYIQGQYLRTHRVAFYLSGRAFPEGLELDHVCRNRKCIRPDHLEPVTSRENQLRGQATKTRCKNGHDYTGENVELDSDGARRCAICRKATALAYFYRHRDRVLTARRERRSRGLAN